MLAPRDLAGLCAMVLFLVGSPSAIEATEPTVGVVLHDEGEVSEGYVLFAPLRSNSTYLIDNYGREVHSWEGDAQPGASVYMLDSGDILRTAKADDPVGTFGGYGGRVEQVNWEGDVVWEYEYSTESVLQHHDIVPMPDGNVLILAWEVFNEEEAIQKGRNPLTAGDGVWPDHIIEVDPDSDEIVWEWHAWDHMIQDFDETKENYGIVADHPELIDINAGSPSPDWMHSNSLDYNEDLDQILISVRAFNEIWIIDHSTTTEEAAGSTGGNSDMGGDLLYRWGNPQTYGAGDDEDQVFFGQHDARWIPAGLEGAGNILVFNNGETFSSIEEFEPPLNDDDLYDMDDGEAYGPDSTTWTFKAENEEDFYAPFVSGATRLENGNTITCLGTSGVFIELNTDDEVVWQYVNPIVGDDDPVTQGQEAPTSGPESNLVFRCTRVPADHSGLKDKILTPGAPLELLPELGDFDDDGDVDEDDRDAFADLFTGPCDTDCDLPLFPTALGFVADFDEDNDVDCDDWTSFEAAWSDPLSNPFLDDCEVASFLRGDADGDGVVVGIVDAIRILAYAFVGGAEPPCLDAADVDGDDQIVGIADAAALLMYAYGDGLKPADPGPTECGPDPAGTFSLGCEQPNCL